VCAHGVRLSCGEVHKEDDPRLGQPLCPDCLDYERAVIWNALAPELWRRTAIQIRRELARILGISQRRVRKRVRVSFAKVAEGRRGREPAPDPASGRVGAVARAVARWRPRVGRAVADV
jgi:hypothetical protein